MTDKPTRVGQIALARTQAERIVERDHTGCAGLDDTPRILAEAILHTLIAIEADPERRKAVVGDWVRFRLTNDGSRYAEGRVKFQTATGALVVDVGYRSFDIRQGDILWVKRWDEDDADPAPEREEPGALSREELALVSLFEDRMAAGYMAIKINYEHYGLLRKLIAIARAVDSGVPATPPPSEDARARAEREVFNIVHRGGLSGDSLAQLAFDTWDAEMGRRLGEDSGHPLGPFSELVQDERDAWAAVVHAVLRAGVPATPPRYDDAKVEALLADVDDAHDNSVTIDEVPGISAPSDGRGLRVMAHSHWLAIIKDARDLRKGGAK